MSYFDVYFHFNAYDKPYPAQSYRITKGGKRNSGNLQPLPHMFATAFTGLLRRTWANLVHTAPFSHLDRADSDPGTNHGEQIQAVLLAATGNAGMLDHQSRGVVCDNTTGHLGPIG
jgi:hypothetical protein